MGSNPTVCELDPNRHRFGSSENAPCDGPPTEEFRQHSTRVGGTIVPLPQPGIWGARCHRHAQWVDRELNESRRLV